MLTPSRAYMAGGPQGPVKCSPLRQDMAPRPILAPTPNAAFLTEGSTMTHSERSSQYLGRLSGMLRISIRTSPECFNLFCSFSCAEAATDNIADTATNARIFRMTILHQDLVQSSGETIQDDITGWLRIARKYTTFSPERHRENT